jgi:large subunit ribosomal protein L15
MLKLFSAVKAPLGRSVILLGGTAFPKTILPSASMRCMSTTVNSHRLLNTDDLQPLFYRKRRRVGRGIGSGRGKTSGNGHQKSKATPRAFEGGQTPLYKRLPKIGFHNIGALDFQAVNVDKIQDFLDMERLDNDKSRLMNMRDLVEAGLITNAKGGVKLLAGAKSNLKDAIHIEVSNASDAAIKAVEAAGGTVTCVHFNKLAMRALIHPLKFETLPRRARPPPRLMDMYLDGTKCGYLSPEIQARNLRRFGDVTSENRLQQEHVDYMNLRRKIFALKASEAAEAKAKLETQAASGKN